MATKPKRCTSCGVEVLKEYTEFKCPNCGESEFVRCWSCRVLGTPYICDKCGFTGP